VLATPGASIHEAEVQDVFRIVCNVANVRKITGKRLQGRPSIALGIIYRHQAERPAMEEVRLASPSHNKSNGKADLR